MGRKSLMPEREPPYFTKGNLFIIAIGFGLAFGLALLVMQP
jgi:hypothetical protein